MRSNQSRNRNLGIQSSQKSAKGIVRRDSDRRPSMFAQWYAFLGYASRHGLGLCDALSHGTTATRWATTRVTGGACGAMPQRSQRHAMCRFAAR